jgi:predicted DNA-binding protein
MNKTVKKNIYFKLPVEIDEALKALKEQTGIDKNFATEKALRKYLAEQSILPPPTQSQQSQSGAVVAE